MKPLCGFIFYLCFSQSFGILIFGGERMDEPLQILLRDKAFAVCVKPPGCLSEPGPGRNLPALFSEACLAQGTSGDVYTVHRLDREVGGLTVLARTHDAASQLIGQFSSHSVNKEYYAVLRGVPAQAHAVLEDLLFRDAAKNKTYVVTRPRKGVREAKLAYHLLESVPDGDQTLSLVRIRLYTGRTHQIRVQFASRKHPLLGDGRYGGKDGRCEIALFACCLSFDHPTTGRRMRFYQQPPLDAFPWNCFPKEKYISISPFSTQDT